MKKLIIVKPGCNEFANHLLNYMSIYAAGLELGLPVVNPSFYQYHHFFNLVRHESIPVRVLASLARWQANTLWKILYAVYARIVIRVHSSCVRHAWRGLVYLPPSQSSTEKTDSCETTYFFGWLYRNPRGLTRYRNTLLETFAPHTRWRKKMQKTLAPVRHRKLIGIHIRRESYKGFPDGEFLVSPERVRDILDEYLKQNNLESDDVAIIIVSDTALPEGTFGKFTTLFFKKTDAMNLFLLSQCAVVIGTNTTFCFLSSWFGNIPHIVTTDEEINWEYYRDKEKYFENKYETFVLGMPATQSVHEPQTETAT